MRKNMNIVLIGMSGAGKSTLGVLLAKALGMDFVDTDIVIQQHEGRMLQEIIDNDGIVKFMEVEEKIVSDLQLNNWVICSCRIRQFQLSDSCGPPRRMHFGSTAWQSRCRWPVSAYLPHRCALLHAKALWLISQQL